MREPQRTPSSAFLPVGIILLLSIAASAALGADAGEFDKNGDGKLDREELVVLFLHSRWSDFSALDANKDGVLDSDELASGPGESVRELIADLAPLQPPYDVVVVQAYLDERSGKGEFPDLFGIMVRGSHDVVTVTTPAKSRAKSTPAIVSYTRDFENDADIWQVTAAILRPFVFAPDWHPAVEKIAVTPSLFLDRLTNEGDSSKEKSAFIPRLELEGELAGPLDGSYLRLFGSYATDFDFDTEVAAVEIEWEPVWNRAGIGLFVRPWATGVGQMVEFRWRPIVHFEGGYVWDVGQESNLEEDHDFARLGPKLEFALRPTGEPRLSLTTTIGYLGGLAGRPKSSYHLRSILAFALDSEQRVSITLSYEKGETPLVEDEVNNLAIGLGLKF